MDKNETKTLKEAVELVKSNSKSKFVGSVNLDVLLNLKDKKEVIRGSVTFPHSLGDEKKVIVFADEKDAKTAKENGADKAGLEDLLEEVLNGYLDFDVVIATPAAMPKIVKAAKILGPKGLMPNPKNGTVTADVASAVKSFKAGKINFKSIPDQGTIKLKVGKVDMPDESLIANITEILKAITAETKKPANTSFKKVTLSPTMGTGVRVDISDIMQQL